MEPPLQVVPTVLTVIEVKSPEIGAVAAMFRSGNCSNVEKSRRSVPFRSRGRGGGRGGGSGRPTAVRAAWASALAGRPSVLRPLAPTLAPALATSCGGACTGGPRGASAALRGDVGASGGVEWPSGLGTAYGAARSLGRIIRRGSWPVLPRRAPRSVVRTQMVRCASSSAW
jgi:hypothetical protein